MDDKGLKLNTRLLPLPAEDADRLLDAADGDCALLYLHLLRRGEGRPRAETAKALGMDAARLERAAAKLCALGLARGAAKLPPAENELPEYSAEEIARRSMDDPAFRGVLSETESILGRKLSGGDMKTLYGVYEHLGLPPEVMLLLVHHCLEDCRARYGPGRVPTVRQIEKEAYYWANREIMTLDAAEDLLKEKKERRSAEAQIRRALGIRDREPAPTERRYIDSWLSMGFPAEAVELALDRTVANTGALKWSYMDKILQSWHGKGLHSTAEIEAGDGRGRKSQSTPARADDNEAMRRAFEKLKNGNK